MEVCVDNIESALNGTRGGAIRLELCSALNEGGLTPSIGMLLVIKRLVKVPVFCMVRPRNGSDFVYSEHEVDTMINDIRLFKEYGADGFVFGCLTENKKIDVRNCQRLLAEAAPLPSTFHRAYDFVEDPYGSLELLIGLGFTRILTSGRAPNVEYGLELIKELIKLASGRIIIMPGGGVNEFNLSTILKETKATEFHGSAKTLVRGWHSNRLPTVGSQMSVSTVERVSMCYITDLENVRRMTQIYKVINGG